jgi:hypothetical protein
MGSENNSYQVGWFDVDEGRVGGSFEVDGPNLVGAYFGAVCLIKNLSPCLRDNFSQRDLRFLIDEDRTVHYPGSFFVKHYLNSDSPERLRYEDLKSKNIGKVVRLVGENRIPFNIARETVLENEVERRNLANAGAKNGGTTDLDVEFSALIVRNSNYLKQFSSDELCSMVDIRFP